MSLDFSWRRDCFHCGDSHLIQQFWQMCSWKNRAKIAWKVKIRKVFVHVGKYRKSSVGQVIQAISSRSQELPFYLGQKRSHLNSPEMIEVAARLCCIVYTVLNSSQSF